MGNTLRVLNIHLYKIKLLQFVGEQLNLEQFLNISANNFKSQFGIFFTLQESRENLKGSECNCHFPNLQTRSVQTLSVELQKLQNRTVML